MNESSRTRAVRKKLSLRDALDQTHIVVDVRRTKQRTQRACTAPSRGRSTSSRRYTTTGTMSAMSAVGVAAVTAPARALARSSRWPSTTTSPAVVRAPAPRVGRSRVSLVTRAGKKTSPKVAEAPAAPAEAAAPQAAPTVPQPSYLPPPSGYVPPPPRECPCHRRITLPYPPHRTLSKKEKLK